MEEFFKNSTYVAIIQSLQRTLVHFTDSTFNYRIITYLLPIYNKVGIRILIWGL